MDKLKPILTHKFWILCGIALVLPIVGWFLGTGQLAAAIDTRVQALNALAVPDGSQIPNEDWMAKAKVVQDERQKRLETAGSYLWQEQQKYMTWPSNLRTYVEGKVFEGDLGIDAEERYRRIYNIELDKLIRIVDPYRFNEMTLKEEGKVALDSAALVTLPPDASIWPTAPPSSKEVWYLQEEMWLLRGLLEAVRDVNDKAAADSIVKAPIKQIELIQLQGGDLAALESAGAAAEGGEGGMPGDAHGASPMMTEMAARYTAGGEGGAAGGATVDFDLAEEVGPNAPVASAEEGAEGEAAPTDAHGGGGMPGLAGMAGMMGGAGAGTPNPLLNEKRYVEDDKTAPFKTRAFKMQVVMDHRKLQEFLAELTNSPFPVRIVRVHWAELNPDPRFAGDVTPTGEGGMPGGGRSGMPGAGRGGFGGMPGAGRGGFGAGGGRGGMPMPTGGLGSLGGRMPGGAGGRGGMPMPGAGRGGFGAGGRGGMGSLGMPMPGAGRGGFGAGGGRGGMPMPGAGRGGMPVPGMRTGGNLPGMNYEGEGLAGDTGEVNLYAQAMTSPYLAQVVVGGVITIYRSPEEMAEGATDGTTTDAAATDADPAATAETTPTTEGEAPAETTSPDGTVPPDGAVPEEAAPADGTLPVDPSAAPAGDTTPPGDGTPADPAVPAETTTGTPPAEGNPADAAAPTDSTATPTGDPAVPLP